MASRKRIRLSEDGDICVESTESLMTECWVPQRTVAKLRMRRGMAFCELGGGRGGRESGFGEEIRGVLVVGGGDWGRVDVQRTFARA